MSRSNDILLKFVNDLCAISEIPSLVGFSDVLSNTQDYGKAPRSSRYTPTAYRRYISSKDVEKFSSKGECNKFFQITLRHALHPSKNAFLHWFSPFFQELSAMLYTHSSNLQSTGHHTYTVNRFKGTLIGIQKLLDYFIQSVQEHLMKKHKRFSLLCAFHRTTHKVIILLQYILLTRETVLSSLNSPHERLLKSSLITHLNNLCDVYLPSIYRLILQLHESILLHLSSQSPHAPFPLIYRFLNFLFRCSLESFPHQFSTKYLESSYSCFITISNNLISMILLDFFKRPLLASLSHYHRQWNDLSGIINAQLLGCSRPMIYLLDSMAILHHRVSLFFLTILSHVFLNSLGSTGDLHVSTAKPILPSLQTSTPYSSTRASPNSSSRAYSESPPKRESAALKTILALRLKSFETMFDYLPRVKEYLTIVFLCLLQARFLALSLGQKDILSTLGVLGNIEGGLLDDEENLRTAITWLELNVSSSNVISEMREIMESFISIVDSDSLFTAAKLISIKNRTPGGVFSVHLGENILRQCMRSKETAHMFKKSFQQVSFLSTVLKKCLLPTGAPFADSFVWSASAKDKDVLEQEIEDLKRRFEEIDANSTRGKESDWLLRYMVSSMYCEENLAVDSEKQTDRGEYTVDTDDENELTMEMNEFVSQFTLRVISNNQEDGYAQGLDIEDFYSPISVGSPKERSMAKGKNLLRSFYYLHRALWEIYSPRISLLNHPEVSAKLTSRLRRKRHIKKDTNILHLQRDCFEDIHPIAQMAGNVSLHLNKSQSYSRRSDARSERVRKFSMYRDTETQPRETKRRQSIEESDRLLSFSFEETPYSLVRKRKEIIQNIGKKMEDSVLYVSNKSMLSILGRNIEERLLMYCTKGDQEQFWKSKYQTCELPLRLFGNKLGVSIEKDWREFIELTKRFFLHHSTYQFLIRSFDDRHQYDPRAITQWNETCNTDFFNYNYFFNSFISSYIVIIRPSSLDSASYPKDLAPLALGYDLLLNRNINLVTPQQIDRLVLESSLLNWKRDAQEEKICKENVTLSAFDRLETMVQRAKEDIMTQIFGLIHNSEPKWKEWVSSLPFLNMDEAPLSQSFFLSIMTPPENKGNGLLSLLQYFPSLMSCNYSIVASLDEDNEVAPIIWEGECSLSYLKHDEQTPKSHLNNLAREQFVFESTGGNCAERSRKLSLPVMDIVNLRFSVFHVEQEEGKKSLTCRVIRQCYTLIVEGNGVWDRVEELLQSWDKISTPELNGVVTYVVEIFFAKDSLWESLFEQECQFKNIRWENFCLNYHRDKRSQWNKVLAFEFSKKAEAIFFLHHIGWKVKILEYFFFPINHLFLD